MLVDRWQQFQMQNYSSPDRVYQKLFQIAMQSSILHSWIQKGSKLQTQGLDLRQLWRLMVLGPLFHLVCPTMYSEDVNRARLKRKLMHICIPAFLHGVTTQPWQLHKLLRWWIYFCQPSKLLHNATQYADKLNRPMLRKSEASTTAKFKCQITWSLPLYIGRLLTWYSRKVLAKLVTNNLALWQISVGLFNLLRIWDCLPNR